MQCLQCGAEMRLVVATHDDTMMVPGYEDQTFECTGCGEREQRRIFRSASPEPASGAAEPVPAELAASEAAVVELGSMADAPTDAVAIAVAPAAAPEAVPLQTVSASVAPVCASSSDGSQEIDADYELLSRAIAMVRTPSRGSQPLRGITDGLKPRAVPPANPPSAKDNRVVQIRHDPSYEAPYAAKDTRSGLVMMRNKDSARLRAMCERLGWQVIEDGTAASDS
jgi:hypothetical protein